MKSKDARLGRALLSVVLIMLCLAATGAARADAVRIVVLTFASDADYQASLKAGPSVLEVYKKSPGVKSTYLAVNPKTMTIATVTTYGTAEQAATAAASPEYAAATAPLKNSKRDAYILDIQ